MDKGGKLWKKSIFAQLADAQPVQQDPVSKRRRLEDKTFNKDASNSKLATEKTLLEEAPSISANWMDEFAPDSIDALAIHTKKVAELQNWLKHYDTVRSKQPAQLCLLTGPAGSGKTATVRVLAEIGQFALQEWINPTDSEIVEVLGDQSGKGNYVTSQVVGFKSFLLRASRYRSLLDRYDKRVLLVEDFPNALISDATAFEDILANYLLYGKSPLIFIATDSKSRGLNISYNLFPDEIKEKFGICHISFNAIANTFMQKAMKRFCAIMRNRPENVNMYEIPSQSVIDSIALSAQGDIRNALINLHFAALKGTPRMTTVPVKAENSSRKKRQQQSKLKSVGRDESITMMHALGRAFNPKYSNGNNTEKRLTHNPDEIADAFSTEPKKFIDFLHANYLPHFSCIDNVVLATESLSQSDIQLRDYREDALAVTALHVAVRGIMVANRTPVAGWMPVCGPKRIKANSTSLSQISASKHYISSSLYATDYSTYVNCLENYRSKFE